MISPVDLLATRKADFHTEEKTLREELLERALTTLALFSVRKQSVYTRTRPASITKLCPE